MMRLEVATFPVSRLDLLDAGPSELSGETLRLNPSELAQILKEDDRLVDVSVEVVRPTDAARIIPVHDVIEPRVKVVGSGVIFPGVSGRQTTTAGEGRTHRLSGVAVVESAPLPGLGGTPGWNELNFYLDAQGPGAVPPYAGLTLVVVLVVPRKDIPAREQSESAWGATATAADFLARLTLQAQPASVEIFELAHPTPDLPGVVYMPLYNSPQHYGGALNSFGLAIYGNTNLTPPWLLHPNEYFDGAVTRGGTWIHENQPQILDLYRADGKDLVFKGVIAQRTRWTAEAEKRLTAQQAAKIARILHAQGALITWDYGGNDFLEVAYTIDACEALGIRTVLITHEQGTRLHAGGTLLFVPPRAEGIVSTGTLDPPSLGKPDRVVGFPSEGTPGDFTSPPEGWFIFGFEDRYGLRHLGNAAY